MLRPERRRAGPARSRRRPAQPFARVHRRHEPRPDAAGGQERAKPRCAPAKRSGLPGPIGRSSTTRGHLPGGALHRQRHHGAETRRSGAEGTAGSSCSGPRRWRPSAPWPEGWPTT
ncbi:MAG: Hid1 family protein [Desulfobacterales bacterium]|nr:Hid1 family protein [Desulfobacterales bacterium]